MSEEALTVREVMSTTLRTVDVDDSIDRAARIMEEHGVRQLVVVDERGGLLGILSYRDLLRRVGQPHDLGDDLRVGTLMDPDPHTFRPDMRLIEAVRAMVAGTVSAAPVVEDGLVVGILSEHDVVGLTRRLLKEAGW